MRLCKPHCMPAFQSNTYLAVHVHPSIAQITAEPALAVEVFFVALTINLLTVRAALGRVKTRATRRAQPLKLSLLAEKKTIRLLHIRVSKSRRKSQIKKKNQSAGAHMSITPIKRTWYGRRTQRDELGLWHMTLAHTRSCVRMRKRKRNVIQPSVQAASPYVSVIKRAYLRRSSGLELFGHQIRLVSNKPLRAYHAQEAREKNYEENEK